MLCFEVTSKCASRSSRHTFRLAAHFTATNKCKVFLIVKYYFINLTRTSQNIPFQYWILKNNLINIALIFIKKKFM